MPWPLTDALIDNFGDLINSLQGLRVFRSGLSLNSRGGNAEWINIRRPFDPRSSTIPPEYG